MTITYIEGLNWRRGEFDALYKRFSRELHLTTRIGSDGRPEYFMNGSGEKIPLKELDVLGLLVERERKSTNR